MSHTRIWVYLIIASTLLSVVSGSLFVSFEHWMVTQSPSAISAVQSLFPENKPTSVQSVSPVSKADSPQLSVQRIMLSTAWDEDKSIQKPVKTPSLKTQVTTNISTRVSSMSNRQLNRFDSQPIRQATFEQSEQAVRVNPSFKHLNLTQERKAEIASQTLTPSFVIYPNELIIEFPKAIASTQNIKKAVSRLLLSRHLVQDGNLLSNTPLNYAKRPYFYRKVLNKDKQPIRYPKQAYDYVKYLLANSTEAINDESGQFIEVHIPLHERGLKGPAKTYQVWVNDYASKFDINPALVYAVMETESGFNPKAVSRSNAIGLMQLKPEAAGKDVYQYVDGKAGQPSKWDLFDSEKNIRMGIAYLSLLKHDYLSTIRNDKIKQMVTISSYNGGMKTVLGLFGKTPQKAIDRLNRLSPKQVYRTLRYQHQSDETRRYLDKVLQAESRYKSLLDDAA